MPYANLPESEWDKMDRCVDDVMAKGNDKDSAIAICYTSITEGKSIDEINAMLEAEKAANIQQLNIEDEVKVGARHNQRDQRALQDIHDAAIVLGAACPPAAAEVTEIPLAKSEDFEDVLVTYGGAVKALGDDKVGGYLVRFSTDADTDLEGEFFDAATDLGDATEGKVYYEHGQDTKFGKRILTKSTHTRDEFGIWAEAQLNRADQYEAFLLKMAEKGKLGWSSGTASHLVDREPKGKAVWIKSWPLGLDDSLTLTPAEPRNRAKPLKSITIPEIDLLMDAPASEEAVQDGGAKPEVESKSITDMEGTTMEITEERLQELIEGSIDKAMKALPAVTSDVKVTKDEADQPLPAGEFFQAVKTAYLYPGHEDPRLRSLNIKATGLSEGVPADGGYLLTPQVASGLIDKMYGTGQILARVAPGPLGPNTNSMLFNGMDETTRVAGSRSGGILGYWTAEAGTITATKPKFYQLELKLKKVAALVYCTDEQLADTVFLEAWLSGKVADELRFMVEDAIFEGDGIGKPLGIMNAPCLVSPLREDASEVNASDFANMWARRYPGVDDYVWLINASVFPQIVNLSVGNVPLLLPNNAPGTGNPVFTIYGKPVIETEYNATMGDAGDVVLASLGSYQTITRGGIQSATSIYTQFVTDETAFRFIYRIDGAPLWHSPLTPFHGSATISPFVALASASV